MRLFSDNLVRLGLIGQIMKSPTNYTKIKALLIHSSLVSYGSWFARSKRRCWDESESLIEIWVKKTWNNSSLKRSFADLGIQCYIDIYKSSLSDQAMKADIRQDASSMSRYERRIWVWTSTWPLSKRRQTKRINIFKPRSSTSGDTSSIIPISNARQSIVKKALKLSFTLKRKDHSVDNKRGQRS